MYVASPKPEHAGRKVPFEKGSVSAPVLTAFTIASERTENKMLEAIIDIILIASNVAPVFCLSYVVGQAIGTGLSRIRATAAADSPQE